MNSSRQQLSHKADERSPFSQGDAGMKQILIDSIYISSLQAQQSGVYIQIAYGLYI